MILSTFIMVSNHNHYLFPKLFILPETLLIKQQLPISSFFPVSGSFDSTFCLYELDLIQVESYLSFCMWPYFSTIRFLLSIDGH